jgi:hemin uptake protein HemP
MDDLAYRLQRRIAPDPENTPPRLSSEVLFGAQREVVIVHNGREYRLRLTQNDKMILTA